jgi:HPt (histidine-containing phosphotransfer) domain-containing protein
VLGKVWRLFLGQAPDAVFKLETLCAGGDPVAVAKQAHFLKSMCLSSGASRLAGVFEDIEQTGKEGRMADVCDRLIMVRPQLEESFGVMANPLSSRQAAAR